MSSYSERTEPLIDERELEVLAHVHEAQNQAERQSQRSIARALGMSVGLTNAILKRLAAKGFVMMRRINHNNVHYLVTPEGVEEIGRRSYLYLRRTIGHVVRYRDRLRAFCREQKNNGVREIVLIGQSDLSFLLEWCAQKEGIAFEQAEHSSQPFLSGGAGGPGTGAERAERQAGRVFLYGETTEDPGSGLTVAEVLVARAGRE
jgi:DNA-binding MarR family transcriptional regulator